jgi:DNA-binding beta-propeller fold protein YncE
LGNNSVEMVDIQKNKLSSTIPRCNFPEGISYIGELNRLVVSNAGDGTVRFFSGDSLRLIKTVELGGEVDNMQYDPSAREIIAGYGNGAIAIINAVSGERITDIDLPGHPEAFAIESSGKRIFVNVPSAQQITVVDRENRSVMAAWRFRGLRNNFPLAMDEKSHRLFVVFRSPATFAVIDSDSGKLVAAMECVRDADDIFFNAVKKEIYISGGDGWIDAFIREDADHYNRLPPIPSAHGARTSLFVPERKALYVAIPKGPFVEAQVREYRIP